MRRCVVREKERYFTVANIIDIYSTIHANIDLDLAHTTSIHTI